MFLDVSADPGIQLGKGLNKDTLHYFIAESTWTKSSPRVYGKRLPMKKSWYDIMVEIPALGLISQLCDMEKEWLPVTQFCYV